MKKELKLFYKVLSIETLVGIVNRWNFIFFLKINYIRKSNPNKNQ